MPPKKEQPPTEQPPTVIRRKPATLEKHIPEPQGPQELQKPPDTTRPKRRERFGREKPPQSLEEATKGLDEVVVCINKIKAQLDTTNPLDFPSVETYDDWVSSAQDALGYFYAEKGYLEKWIKNFDKMQEEARKNAVLRYVKTLAETLGGRYKKVYNEDHLPETLELAQQRLTELGILREDLACAFSEVAALCCVGNGFVKNDLPVVKYPLQEILTPVNIETLVIKGYIRKILDANNKKLATLRRAVLRILKGDTSSLTPDEIEALKGDDQNPPEEHKDGIEEAEQE